MSRGLLSYASTTEAPHQPLQICILDCDSKSEKSNEFFFRGRDKLAFFVHHRSRLSTDRWYINRKKSPPCSIIIIRRWIIQSTCAFPTFPTKNLEWRSTRTLRVSFINARIERRIPRAYRISLHCRTRVTACEETKRNLLRRTYRERKIYTISRFWRRSPIWIAGDLREEPRRTSSLYARDVTRSATNPRDKIR